MSLKSNSKITDPNPKQAKLDQKFFFGLVQEIFQVMRQEPDALVPYFSGETNPEDIKLLSYSGSKVETSNSNKTEKKLLPPSAKLPPNFRCDLCQRRYYPVQQFFRLGKESILVLHYNGPLHAKLPLQDKSKSHIFGGAKEDELFSRMIGKLNFQLSDFHYQEYIACHFNPKRSISDDWQQRAKNCQTHVLTTIKENNIKKLILLGEAAIFLLGEDKAKAMAAKACLFPLQLEDSNSKSEHIDCIVLRSPAALLAIEKRRKQQQNLSKEDYHTLLQQEKEIKTNTLTALEHLVGSFTSRKNN